MKRKLTIAGAILMVALITSGFSCAGSSTQKLATASDAIAHALAEAQTAAQQATTQGVMSQADFATFQSYLVTVSTAGEQLDAAIRANESATTVQQKVDNFMNAFNTLQQTGLVGIKDPNTKLVISTIITAAETSLAVIEATVGK